MPTNVLLSRNDTLMWFSKHYLFKFPAKFWLLSLKGSSQFSTDAPAASSEPVPKETLFWHRPKTAKVWGPRWLRRCSVHLPTSGLGVWVPHWLQKLLRNNIFRGKKQSQPRCILKADSKDLPDKAQWRQDRSLRKRTSSRPKLTCLWVL